MRPECRVCLKKDGILPVFGDESKPDISLEISLFGDIQVHESDDLPKLICVNCFKLLEGAISFRKSAKRTEAILKRRKKKNELAMQQPSSFKTKNIKSEAIIYFDSAQSQITDNTDQFLNPEMNTVQNKESRLDFVSVDMDISYIGQDTCSKDTSAYVQTEERNKNDVFPNTSKRMRGLIHCKYCNVSFQTLDSLEEHRTTVEHKRNYVKSFLPKIKSRSPKDQMCEFCNKLFTKMQYSRHMLLEHNTKVDTYLLSTKKQCTLCNEMLHPRALNNHMKRKHRSQIEMKPKIKLECPICKKLFSKDFYPLHLQRHKQGDTKDYVCDQCGKKFFFKSSFFTHRLIHTNALPHKCEYCPYRGRTKELLKIHVRTHTGDYPYKCTQCETRCSTKSNLNSHMRRHRGPIDFICDVCNRGFYTKLQLERHISVIHYGVKNHICSICGAAFGYRHGLMSHQRKVHKRPKGLGKPKAVYLQLEEEGLLPPETIQEV